MELDQINGLLTLTNQSIELANTLIQLVLFVYHIVGFKTFNSNALLRKQRNHQFHREGTCVFFNSRHQF